jgi:hypothetical protein
MPKPGRMDEILFEVERIDVAQGTWRVEEG